MHGTHPIALFCKFMLSFFLQQHKAAHPAGNAWALSGPKTKTFRERAKNHGGCLGDEIGNSWETFQDTFPCSRTSETSGTAVQGGGNAFSCIPRKNSSGKITGQPENCHFVTAISQAQAISQPKTQSARQQYHAQ